jgi:catechol 2,3-dioxygenase-like lactoylglutathione lyase family enzyme
MEGVVPMRREIAAVTFLVRDYDEAIAFFVTKLSFVLLEDTPLEPGKRWVIVAPTASGGSRLLLAKAVGDQQGMIGRQAGGRVFLFLHSDDFWRDHRLMSEKGVIFVEAPRREPYGIVAVFEDLYGNRWDLLEPAARNGA